MSQTKFTYHVSSSCCLCGDCLAVCPTGAITLDSLGANIDPFLCLACGRCAAGCRAGAIECKRS